MTNCQTLTQIQYLVEIELNPTSHCPGNIEAACKIANNLITDNDCGDSNGNVMAVAIAYGDFHLSDPFRFLDFSTFVFFAFLKCLESFISQSNLL